MSEWSSEWTPESANKLLAPFPAIGFLPRGSGDNRAGLAYIESRDVYTRLDSVFGPSNWTFNYTTEVLTERKCVVNGILTVCGVVRCDAGEADCDDTGRGNTELLKAAISDAIKRCAVQFGIGRYLYYLPTVFGRWDERKRTWAEPPRMDAAALTKALKAVGYRWGGELPAVETVSPPEGENAPSRPVERQQQRSAPAGGARQPSGTTQNSAPSSAGISLQCEVCKRSLTEKIVSFCKSKGMPPLCMDHQREWTPGAPKSPDEQWDADRDAANDEADYPDPFEDS